MTAAMLGCAYVIDLVVGDPEWFPHPVRGIGKGIAMGESFVRPGHGRPARDLWWGAGVTAAVVLLTAGSAVALLTAARRMHPYVGVAAEVLLAWTVMATGSLRTEASRVLDALEEGNLIRARKQLARIVGRDTNALTESEVSRGAIEAVAESTCDGIVAPLCYLVVGGVPAALAYKAVNTLDSMIGHPDPPYTYFGRVAARLDDVANLVPARVAALAIATAAGLTGDRGGGALCVWWNDCGKHDSPNAGHPEAAMAGALGVTLGGTNHYDGVPSTKPLLGAGTAPATCETARRACRIMMVASFLTCLLALVAMVAVGAR